MVDPLAVIRAYLATVEGLTFFVGDRIYMDVDWPTDYRPAEDGPAILANIRPGGLYPDSDPLAVPSMQYQVCAETPELAHEVGRALYSALHNQSGPGIKLSTREALDQLLPPTEPGWYIVFTAYRHWLTNS